MRYFNDVEAEEIIDYLIQHGLFSSNDVGEIEKINKVLEKKKVWEFVEKQFSNMKKEWSGPDADIFILPFNFENRQLMRELNGKSGLGFKDKIFLFVTQEITLNELKGLLIHEYHHVCRLKTLGKDLSKMTLLDSILIEGLAEYAVEEYVGSKYLGIWTKLYNEEELLQFWNQYLKDDLNLLGKEKHHHYLYGKGLSIPKWLGYSIGYHCVKSIVKNNQHLTTKKMLKLNSEILFKKSIFSDK
jgi:uncharacterized protein YjaZ